MTAEMNALVVTRTGGGEVLEVQRRPVPTPGPGQVRIRVAASGVNFIDVYRREGVYPVDPPFVLGGECAGTVDAVGEGVTGIAEGDVVATAAALGSHAELTLADAARTAPVPAGLDADVAAAALLQGMTAHYLVHSTYPVREGDDVLVHAAAGGAGQLLVQLATSLGARVIATVGSEAKVAVAREAGAVEVIRYDETGTGDALSAAVREHAPDGVHVVYDGVGQATFEASLGALRRRGTLALFGAASGQVPPFDLQRLNPLGSLFVTRPTLVDYVATDEDFAWRSGDVLRAAADGTLRISIGARHPLTDARQCYADLEGRRTTGKVLLIP